MNSVKEVLLAFTILWRLRRLAAVESGEFLDGLIIQIMRCS